MVTRFTALWIAGLLTLVPYCVYYLFYQAQRDEYALYIVLPLFWIFGYWGVAGPIIAAVRVRRMMLALETIRTREQLEALIRSPEARETAIDLLARENRLPHFLAHWVVALMEKKLFPK